MPSGPLEKTAPMIWTIGGRCRFSSDATWKTGLSFHVSAQKVNGTHAAGRTSSFEDYC
jgi:hypothetical protein